MLHARILRQLEQEFGGLKHNRKIGQVVVQVMFLKSPTLVGTRSMIRLCQDWSQCGELRAFVKVRYRCIEYGTSTIATVHTLPLDYLYLGLRFRKWPEGSGRRIPQEKLPKALGGINLSLRIAIMHGELLAETEE